MALPEGAKFIASYKKVIGGPDPTWVPPKMLQELFVRLQTRGFDSRHVHCNRKGDNMYDLYLTYNEYRSGGDIEDPSDRWSNREPEHIDFSPKALFMERPEDIFAHGLSDEEIYIKDENLEFGKNVFLVVVRYQTGDTFGYSTGNWHIVGVFDDPEKAKETKKQINDDLYNGYKPWDGYFEHLEDVEVHLMFLQ